MLHGLRETAPTAVKMMLASGYYSGWIDHRTPLAVQQAK